MRCALHLLAYLGADLERSPVGVIRSRAAHCINDDIAVDGGFLALRQLVVLKQHAALFLAFVVEKLTVLIRVGLHIMQRHDRIVNVFARFRIVVCALGKRVKYLGLLRVQGFIAALAPCTGLIAGALAEQQRLCPVCRFLSVEMCIRDRPLPVFPAVRQCQLLCDCSMHL